MSTDLLCRVFFFFNDTATTEIYTLSLHDALPISQRPQHQCRLILLDRQVGTTVLEPWVPRAAERAIRVIFVKEIAARVVDRKSTRLNSSHLVISYAVFCLKKKKKYEYIYGKTDVV